MSEKIEDDDATPSVAGRDDERWIPYAKMYGLAIQLPGVVEAEILRRFLTATWNGQVRWRGQRYVSREVEEIPLEELRKRPLVWVAGQWVILEYLGRDRVPRYVDLEVNCRDLGRVFQPSAPVEQQQPPAKRRGGRKPKFSGRRSARKTFGS